jgi:cytochrome bd ubiquinol oxidase subunit II
MSLAEAALGLAWLGLTAYAVFGGADFGGGFWDLVARRGRAGAAQRQLIEDVIAPVWEANHVWLIFVLVVSWTAFPPVFAAVASTLYIPLTGAAFGIILRGSGFAFRTAVHGTAWEGFFGRTFALSSVITPFFLGTVAGAIASGRVPSGNARGEAVASWLNGTSLLGGTLAVGICAYLAAVFLTADAQRRGLLDVAEGFRQRGLATGVIVGAAAIAGIGVLVVDAPNLARGLAGPGLPLVITSAAGGIGSLALLMRRRYVYARVAAVIAVVSVLWAWAAAQYPFLLVGELTIRDAATAPATLAALVGGLVIGALVIIPSLVWLYLLSQRAPRRR